MQSQKSKPQTPDEATKERIKNLAVVGNAVLSNVTDVGQQTNFFLAKEALNEFEAGIDALELDDESMRGMKSLIKYLNIKIDRRLRERV
jgi:hypothetical protein